MNGARDQGTMIWVRPETKRRIEKLRIIPEEPVWRVLTRLLDEHESHLSEHGRRLPETRA